MKLLAAPATVAVLALALAALLHPGIPWGPPPESFSVLTTAVALLLVCALAVRAVAGATSDRLTGLAAVALLAGLAGDGIRAHRGSLVLRPGQGANKFEEEGTRGSGLRPLGFEVQLVGTSGDAATLAFSPEQQAVVSSGRSVAHQGYRFGAPVLSPTGDAEELTIRVEGASGLRTVTLVPGEPARSGDLEIAVERYFPDFALDEQQRPFTRSAEPKNPAALLEVKRAGSAFRVFVIRSMPGLHAVADLQASFALEGVRPERALRLHVAREPFALLVATGALLLVAASLVAFFERGRS